MQPYKSFLKVDCRAVRYVLLLVLYLFDATRDTCVSAHKVDNSRPITPRALVVLSQTMLHLSPVARGPSKSSCKPSSITSLPHLPPHLPSPPRPATLSSPKTLALPINKLPTYPPKNRISFACTAVTLTRFSVSAR
jgi:hypothetical protein